MQHFTNKNSFIQKYICRICSLSVHSGPPFCRFAFAVLSCPAVSSGAVLPVCYFFLCVAACVHTCERAGMCVYAVCVVWCLQGRCMCLHSCNFMEMAQAFVCLTKIMETCVHARECPSEHIVFVRCLCSESVSMYVCTDFMHSCT